MNMSLNYLNKYNFKLMVNLIQLFHIKYHIQLSSRLSVIL